MSFSHFPYFRGGPWNDEVFRRFDGAFARESSRRGAGVFPAVNILDDGETYLVRAEVAGLSRESIEVSVKGEELTLRGERVTSVAEAKANYHRRERDGGKFRRVVTLPLPVDADNIRATYKNGVLEIEIPRLPQAKERRITIQ